MSNKYGNFLTMFLVVLIVAILGILGYFVYDMLHSQSVNTNAQTALEQFEQATAAAKKENSNLSTSKEGEKDKQNVVNNTNTADSTRIPAVDVTNTERMYNYYQGSRWHSRGQRFDPAYLHQKNR